MCVLNIKSNIIYNTYKVHEENVIRKCLGMLLW